MAVGDLLEEPNGVVGEIPDRPRRKGRKLRVRVIVLADRQPAERLEKPAFRHGPFPLALLLDP
jgi:hypothetical protein